MTLDLVEVLLLYNKNQTWSGYCHAPTKSFNLGKRGYSTH